MKLELFKPAKPFNVTQAFGIANPSYLQFGFSKHNGIDFTIEPDGLVRAMCDGEVYEVGYNDKAGNYVRYKTNGIVETNTDDGIVGFMYMHAKTCLVTKGQMVKAGDPLIVADNTGFSTGPHTHISTYFVNQFNVKLPLDPTTDNCFDFSPYFNGYFAEDSTKVFSILIHIRQLLANFLNG